MNFGNKLKDFTSAFSFSVCSLIYTTGETPCNDRMVAWATFIYSNKYIHTYIQNDEGDGVRSYQSYLCQTDQKLHGFLVFVNL